MTIGSVITADIVNSTFLPKPLLKRLIKSIESILKAYKYEFYRGDSFQVFIKDNKAALKICLELRLAAKKIAINGKAGIDVRAAIGIGTLNAPIRNLKKSSEEPFVLSGRALDELSQSTDRLRIVCSNENAGDIMRVMARFIDYIFEDLTSKQAEVIFELLLGNNQTEAAKKLKKSQVTINRQARAAGWTEINRLIEEYKNVLSKYIVK